MTTRLEYFIVQEPNVFRWHVVYRIPGTDAVNSIADCPSQSSAESALQDYIREQAKETAWLQVFNKNRQFRPRRFENEDAE